MSVGRGPGLSQLEFTEKRIFFFLNPAETNFAEWKPNQKQEKGKEKKEKKEDRIFSIFHYVWNSLHGFSFPVNGLLVSNCV